MAISYCVSPLEPGTLVWNIRYDFFWHMHRFVLLLGLLLWNHTSVNTSTHVLYCYTATIQNSSDHDRCQDRNFLFIDEPFFEYSNYEFSGFIVLRYSSEFRRSIVNHSYLSTRTFSIWLIIITYILSFITCITCDGCKKGQEQYIFGFHIL